MQRGAVFLGPTVVSLDFPQPDTEILPGVPWGAIDAFPSPAYWAFQVFAQRVQGNRVNYKLGSTLVEEVAACLLGGHGIPAEVGLEAFRHLKRKGAFDHRSPTEEELVAWLSEPIAIGHRTIKYRFARQKSKYLAAAFDKLDSELPPLTSGRDLRDWLLCLPGIGFKTASWIARNWLDADDVAIIDIHILRAGQLGGFFDPDLTVERHYLKLEDQFIKLSKALNVRASELDALIWLEMMSSSTTVHDLLASSDQSEIRPHSSRRGNRAQERHPNSSQLALLT